MTHLSSGQSGWSGSLMLLGMELLCRTKVHVDVITVNQDCSRFIDIPIFTRQTKKASLRKKDTSANPFSSHINHTARTPLAAVNLRRQCEDDDKMG